MTRIWKSEAGARAVQARYLEFLQHWPVPNRQLRVRTGQGETFIVACGPEGAPPILLLQGSGANAVMWMGDVAAWAVHFRVYAIDLIGEPGLSAPSRPPLGSDAYALWLDDVMQALSLPRASIVGVSLGGWVALDYATRRPERVERLVLLAPSGVGRQKRGFLLKALPVLLLGAWGRRRAMRTLAGRTPAQAPPPNPHFAAFVSLIFEHFRPRREPIPRFSDERLERLSMPVMLIAGGSDPLLDSEETQRRLERWAPRLTVRLLPEAGHVLFGQTAPILEFLSERSASAAASSRSPGYAT